jgi:arginyl-tRNA synthetase
MSESIQQAIRAYLENAGAPGASFVVERPNELQHGDYTTNAALAAAKMLGKNPRELAADLAATLKQELSDIAEGIEVAGPGFVNLFLARSAIVSATMSAAEQGTEWGKAQRTPSSARISIEYSNPNPFKEMHIGHLMSNIVGEALSRLIEATGSTVIRNTFGGDVGPHVAKALWTLRKQKVTQLESAKQIGDAYAEGSNAYESDEAAKKEIDDLNTRIYDVVAHQDKAAQSAEDEPLLSLWREGREISMEEFRRLFSILGTKLDYELFDSDTTAGGLRAVEDGLQKGVFEKSEGAIIYRGEKKGLHTLVFVTSRGTPTYETKDIGLALLREERIPNDEVIIVTAAEQIGHFNVFLAALSELAPKVAEKTKHVAHGLLRLPSGKMSSRKGNVITAAELLAQMVARASEKNEDPLIAEQVAVGAIKYMILRQSPGSDIIFDEEKSLSLEGDSGPYLKYALVRAKKILSYANNGTTGTEKPTEPYALERLMLHFPEVVMRAASEFTPNLLVTYLLELAAAWNSFYASEQVLGSPEEGYKQRGARAFLNTMTNGLRLLGIPAPESM